ncbi:phosphorylase [Pleurocapsales cyanobacterium LEGE 06147]|nr:phosphorylase [Pleurocapsales cyanobacterium LEGE 06147]
MSLLIDVILSPQGAEYRAIRRALNQINSYQFKILPIPMGVNSLTDYLQGKRIEEICQTNQPKVLIMGLCGSLSPQYDIGNAVIYQDCIYLTPEKQISSTDTYLTNYIYQKLSQKVSLVTGLTSDRLIFSIAEKWQLGQLTKASVIDMEGFAALEILQQQGIAVAMLRVVSDNSRHDIPDLNQAIATDGRLQPLPAAFAMVKQPIAAARLIKGALQGLTALQQITMELFRE